MDACTAAFGGLVAAGAVFFVIVLVLVTILVATVIKAVIFCRIFYKTGHHWAMGLLTLVPIANLVMLLILAFCDWPIQKELRQLKQKN